jgi:hypothetical protein
MAKPVDDKFLDPTRPIHEPTTFVRGRAGGKFIYLMAKVQAGLPLSVLDRDIILGALRKQWLTAKEHAAFLRKAELSQIETTRELLKYAKKKSPDDPEEWIRNMTGRRSVKAVKQFEKRERKARR